MRDTHKRVFHSGQRSLTVWASLELAARIDRYLQEQVAGRRCVRANRQAWILDLI
ncbi:MAG TPA: hypothetical protein PLW65_34470 [Pseudomonadota bacterium]|nr:hypothetical protein [Pseudomonadota bacterium]